MLAVSLGEHAVVQHGDDATIVAGPDEAANALAEFQNRLGQINSMNAFPPRASMDSTRASMSG